MQIMSNQDKIANVVYINFPLCIAKKALCVCVCVCVCSGKSQEVIFYEYYYSLNLKNIASPTNSRRAVQK